MFSDEDAPNLLEAWLPDVGKGWEPILLALGHVLPEGTKVRQVKEKFGLLRVYVDLPEDVPEERALEIWGAVDMAERLSARYCETCGTSVGVSTSARPGRYWVKTLCGVCRHKAA